MDKCKANCCFLHIFPIKWWEEHKKFSENVAELHTLDDKKLVLTSNNRCCFFEETIMGCRVYNHRPDTCEKFAFHKQLPCPWQKPDGTLRTDKETQQMLKDVNDMFQKIRGEIKNGRYNKKFELGKSENR